MKFYFASDKNFHEKKILPRIPDTIRRDENYWSDRICVSPSINGCLSSTAGRYKRGDELYIHFCETDSFYQPSINDVPDSAYTGEIWIKDEIQMFSYLKIKITEIYPLDLGDTLLESISFTIIG